jgi:hypothetical protein
MAATMNLHLDIDVMAKLCIITEWTTVLRDMMLCGSVILMFRISIMPFLPWGYTLQA